MSPRLHGPTNTEIVPLWVKQLQMIEYNLRLIINVGGQLVLGPTVWGDNGIKITVSLSVYARVCAPSVGVKWAARMVCYTAISETRATRNLHVQCLNYHYESVFRRDKLSESAVSTRATSCPYARLNASSCTPRWHPNNSC